VAYVAGVLTLAFIVFGWPIWPFGVVLIVLLLAADIAIET
jgi:hypothetical protein